MIDADDAACLDRIARPVLDQMGQHYISLEGAINDIPQIANICIHPLILDVAQAALGDGFVLANTAVKWCKPGTPQQGLHADWPLQAVARTSPGSVMPPISGLQVFWMLSESTAVNGATRLVPFSHHTRRGPSRSEYPDEVAAVGKPGTMFFFHNGLWHRVGANTTADQHRVMVDNFYLPAYVYRPPQAWPLVKRDIYDACPARLRELMATSVEPLL